MPGVPKSVRHIKTLNDLYLFVFYLSGCSDYELLNAVNVEEAAGWVKIIDDLSGYSRNY